MRLERVKTVAAARDAADAARSSALKLARVDYSDPARCSLNDRATSRACFLPPGQTSSDAYHHDGIVHIERTSVLARIAGDNRSGLPEGAARREQSTPARPSASLLAITPAPSPLLHPVKISRAESSERGASSPPTRREENVLIRRE